MSETILTNSVHDQFTQDYVRYGLYTTFKRVLSDFRDGLKPVQRRVIYAMWHDNKAVDHRVKTTAVIGRTMELYHAHGDCYRSNTLVYCLDNTFRTIGDIYNSGIQRLDVLVVDPNTRKVVPAVATDFRIGQYTNKIYRIVLTNGAIIECTGNHPHMLNDGTWVKAEDIEPLMILYCKSLRMDKSNGRLRIGRKYIHHLVHDYYYGGLPEGYERHHLDGNYLNNLPGNISGIPKVNHIDEHKGSPEALAALEAGRVSMFQGRYKEKIKAKNAILGSEYNKDQAIRRFQYVIRLMKENGMELTEENYESFRGTIYNLPIISRIIERHPEYGCSSFEDLVNYQLPSLSDLLKAHAHEFDIYKTDLINPFESFLDNRGIIYQIFNKMLQDGIPLTVENYLNYTQKASLDSEKIIYLINLYKIERPYVDHVEIIDVDNEPMYDFTVEGYENMLIPVGSEINRAVEGVCGYSIPMICAHNSSINGAIGPMVNWFESKVPIISAQGSFGNVQGNGPSAPRYTEVKLSKFAMETIIGELADTSKAVDWFDNYSNTTVEPEFLPVKFPLLLVEGSLGIGVGLRADIPSHNLGEVIDATLYLMHNPEGNIALIPDHCMACDIYDTDWESISKTGFGHYKIRGRIDIEDYKNRKALVIKSLPNLTFLNTVSSKIQELVAKKKIVQIERCVDESEFDTMRYVIVLKPGSDPEFVRDMVYKNTPVEQTLRVNLMTLYGLNPLRMSYKSYLLSFLDVRKSTKFRVYANVLQDIQTKIHRRQAYIKILESGEVNEVIKKIRSYKGTDETYLVEWLVKKFDITDLQASYIINASIKSLSIGYLQKYKDEEAQLHIQEDHYQSRLMDEKLIEQDIEQELLEIKAKYGKPRTCKLIKGVDSVDIPRGIMQIVISEKNFIRKVPEGTSFGGFRNDSVKTVLKIDNADSMLIFDEQGKVYKFPVHKIPFYDKSTNGIDIRFLIKGLTANINCIIPESIMRELARKGTHNAKHYLVIVTRNGLYKRMDLDDFINSPSSGILYAKVEPGDYVKDVIITHAAFNLIVYSDKKAISVNVTDIPYLKRNTKGSRAMYNADLIDGLCVLDPNKSDIIVITESGKANRLPIVALPESNNKKGFNVIKLSSNDKINAVMSSNPDGIICIKTLNTYYEIPVAQLKIGSSISTGDKIAPMKSDKIIRCWIK